MSKENNKEQESNRPATVEEIIKIRDLNERVRITCFQLATQLVGRPDVPAICEYGQQIYEWVVQGKMPEHPEVKAPTKLEVVHSAEGVDDENADK